jgi:uncharacterized membrane protein YkoI
MAIRAHVRKATRDRVQQQLRACILIPAMLLPVLSPAAESSSEAAALAAAPSTAKISEEQAKQAALQAVPGEVTDTGVEKKLGKMVYVIEIVARNGGVETDVLVDMDSGKVLGVER